MKALVVYESMFGNTKQVAQAIARGLEKSAEVELVEVSEAPPNPDVDVDLIVAGGPTHAFSMSRASTRGDAIDRGATEGEQGIGLREWIEALPEGPACRQDRYVRHPGSRRAPSTRFGCKRGRPRPLVTTATRAPHRRRASTSTTSKVRCWAGSWTAPKLGQAAGTSLAGPRASDA